MTVSGASKLSGRWPLYLGLGGMIAIIAVSGLDAMLVMREYRRADNQIRRQFLSRNRILNSVRAEVYLSGTFVRDYLLEPNPARAERFGAGLEGVHQKLEADLSSYARQLKPGESEHYEDYRAFHADLVAYWDVMKPILQWDPIKRREEGYTFLRDEVYPRRVAMLEVADRIANLNEQQLNEADARTDQLLSELQYRAAGTTFIGLALGLIMAILSGRRILRLEAEEHARYLEVRQAREQLAGLSARLVQAQEAERRSLSRELHDQVGQSLSAVLVELRSLVAGLASGPVEQNRQKAELIKGLVESTVREVRNMALLLRPSMLDDLGLVPALRWQAREVAKRTNLNISVQAELGADDLPDEHKTCIYRIVQEALHNCSRHALADSVRIQVKRESGLLSLTIEDDGKGFDVKELKGLGLLGMEERASQLGGTCRVRSSPGHGTSLTVELPLPEESRSTTRELNDADSHPVSR